MRECESASVKLSWMSCVICSFLVQLYSHHWVSWEVEDGDGGPK